MKKIKKIILLISLTSFISFAFAQENYIAPKYGLIISSDLAKKHLSVIASDAFEGRETGKAGAEKAARYIANEFKLLGLKPIVNGSYFLNVPIVSHSLKTSFSVNGRLAVNMDDFYIIAPASDRSLSATDIIFVGYGTAGEIANIDLKGKILLWINEDKPKPGSDTNTGLRFTDARSQVFKDLRGRNPAMILGVNRGVDAFIKRFKGHVTLDGMSLRNDSPKQTEISAGYFWITSELASQLLKLSGKTYEELKSAAANVVTPSQNITADVKLTYYTEYKDVTAADVLGYLPGSDPRLKDEVLVISAHYDHLGLLTESTKGDRVNNGADDDGSGTAAMLEIANAFSEAKKDGHGPRRSILFLGNVGEEKGLLGSEYYTDHPVIPLANTIADLNIDMIGRVGTEYIGKPDSLNYIYIIGSGMLSTDLHNAGEKANKTYTNLALDYKYDDLNDPNNFYQRSDHYNFAKHGVPIIFYFSGTHADYHQPGDEVNKINFPLLAKRAKLVFYTAWDLANADKRPVIDGKK